jgi:GTPase-activating protein BEM2
MESSNLNLQDVHTARKMLLHPDGREKLKHQNKGAAIVSGDSNEIELAVLEGELLVVVQSGDSAPSQPSSRATSRPPSSVVEGVLTEKTFTRTPSIRVRPGSRAGPERKASMARRNSLPSISNRSVGLTTSEASSERPLRVRIKAGTLERLIGILAHGLQGVSVAFADDNGEMPLRDGKHWDLRVDQVDFSTVWWNTFRSFVTPMVLFEASSNFQSIRES